METWLRRVLILCGIALAILSLVQFWQWVILFVVNTGIQSQWNPIHNFYSLLTGFLVTLQPLGIGSFCLFAAHKLSPLKIPFGQK